MNPLVISAGQLKQELTKVYNDVNLQLFQIGVTRLRVDFVGDRILFMTYHRRVPAIRSVDEKNRELTRMMDILLIDEFKGQLKQRLEAKYEIKVVSILKDYDPETELSATVVVLERNVETYLQKQS
ncbi:Na-translocating system protein MpsC family protein [Brevibacillus sp. GCM10020057]|uniref:Na-translocating system protein MpsC family protein n=1 Tax=Brevibacillus sp. GCM10020057 TaxID=3317327 RepID=UPI00363656B9